ncbi:MAG: PEP-CTERM sorting domain-containing protein [Sedimentisphaerales bacterium]|nr:PEP-CTERM sorting domain-containing protein [Sedimentisphaerales bacterium]
MRNQVSNKLSVIVLLVSLFSCGSTFGAIVTSPQEGFDIEASTTYDLLLTGLNPSGIFSGELTVTEHWGDFNNLGTVGTETQVEWVNIDIDGIILATEMVFANDNLSNERELELIFNLTSTQMAAIIADGQAIVHVTTSADVDNSLAGSWFQASLSYDVVPEPATMLLLGLGGMFLRRKKA